MKYFLPPFEVKFNIVKSINNLELFAGAFYRNNSQYLPKSYIGFNYRNEKKLNYLVDGQHRYESLKELYNNHNYKNKQRNHSLRANFHCC